jgi:hypothetical protein
MSLYERTDPKIKRKAVFWTIVILFILLGIFLSDSPTKVIDFIKSKIELQKSDGDTEEGETPANNTTKPKA